MRSRHLVDLAALLTVSAALGCASPFEAVARFDSTASSSTSTTGSGGAGGQEWLDPTGSGGAGGGTSQIVTTPVRELEGLSAIAFHETTNVVHASVFDVAGPELTERLPDPLGTGLADIAGAPTEAYAVYYSDEDGVFDIDGSYLTISGVFEIPAPAGGGLNLAEIGLVFDDETVEYGNYVASWVAVGDNALPGDVEDCIDGDLATYTTMGNTLGAKERLRLTLGFLSTSGPPPVH